ALTASQRFPELAGMIPNLYKAFLPTAWALGTARGVAGLLHPDGLYEDPKGGRARRASYQRLRQHYGFVNERTDILFADVDHYTRFGLNIYAVPRVSACFVHVASLYAPKTIDECHAHDGSGPVPGIKTDDN